MTPLFNHQRAAYGELRATAEVFFSRSWKDCALVPRFNRLLIGPSGSGKTHLVRRLADDMKLPLLKLDSTSWIPMGANERSARVSWKDVARFCLANKRGVIFVDEIDKVGAQSSWMTHVRVEMFSLLDKAFPANLRMSDESAAADDEAAEALSLPQLGKKLREKFFLVGGGAFQDLWSVRSSRQIGFGAVGATNDCALDHRDLSAAIPTEIVNRFVTPLVMLPPLGRDDYREMLKSLCETAPPHLRDALRMLGESSIDDAVRSGLGCRWAERLILASLIRVNGAKQHNPAAAGIQ